MKKLFKITYYRETANMIYTKRFRSIDEFCDWYKKQTVSKPITILEFKDYTIPTYEEYKESD